MILARLELRAGDIAHLRLADIDWNNGTLQVIGKGRYQVRLPLPQDVGDALLRIWNTGPRTLTPITFSFEATPLAGRLPPVMVSRP
jgi:integrase